MSRTVHTLLQVLLTVTHVVNVSAFPAKWQPLVAAIAGLAQSALALVNHDPVNR